ncbi:imidazole glycerol phosphate synthase subunit HisH [Paramagnetospirillum kuznetsovii]|uniref:Imidazole glycerol phosphate synthase subunit HisH n=1 Tax=Paramagnetospirillum kuznetsovii TaxID=2053833 RepID=A0A364NTQ5_9PROT|nr:imidazole glycerol phosphate synthase subunit HisH [Paramagnetospirillum kuznetsovii]RAU20257.1 imidazole glycerol phosphate synthase subunit HisH [Paramagnetospirillum kuznetsovii]
MSIAVGVIDMGTSNLASVLRGLQAAGLEPTLLRRPWVDGAFGRVVLPGVGTFKAGMEALTRMGLIDPIRRHVQAGRPLLGICLGAQLLMERGTEFGDHAGLGLIPGTVLRLPETPGRRIPHVGWSAIEPDAPWDETLLSSLAAGAFVYFTHSFACVPDAPSHRLAHFTFGPHRAAAAVAVGSATGLQFHPELSSRTGLDILRRLGQF